MGTNEFKGEHYGIHNVLGIAMTVVNVEATRRSHSASSNIELAVPKGKVQVDHCQALPLDLDDGHGKVKLQRKLKLLKVERWA